MTQLLLIEIDIGHTTSRPKARQDANLWHHIPLLRTYSDGCRMPVLKTIICKPHGQEGRGQQVCTHNFLTAVNSYFNTSFRARERLATANSDLLTDINAYEASRTLSSQKGGKAVRAFCEEV